jgi:hypothetical protein
LALWSLARLARWRARREEGHSWPVTLVLGRWQWGRAHWRDRTYYALAAVWVGLLFVPFPNDWNPFAKAEEAEGFLRTLWQVDAAALALSLAIIVFAVQAYRSANQERYGALRRYIRAAWLQEGYEQGVVALLVTGVVLLGAGHGGVAGSAGAVAGFACFASIFVLPPLLNAALRTSRRDFLREEREERLAAAVSEQVDREVEALHGTSLLTDLAAAEPLELDPYAVGRREQEVNAVVAGMVGSVTDINLRRLIHLARRTQASGGVTLTTRLYEYVGSDSKLLLVPTAPGHQAKLARRVVKLRRGRWRDETLRHYLKDLEEEAVAAIRAGVPGTFESVGDAYVETLMEFPRSWARYGHEYTVAVARGTELFPVGPVSTIRQQFYTSIVEALRGTSDEVLSRAAYLPITVCTRALQYHADGLLQQMVGLTTAFVAGGWTHGGDKGNFLAASMPRHLVEFTRFYLRPGLEEGEVADRLRFGGYVRLVYDQLAAVLKLAVDRGDVDYVKRVDGDWDTLLEHVSVDVYATPPDVMRRLEEEAERGEPGAAERLEEARTVAQLAELVQGLVDRRTVLRFGLALWTWRQKPKAWRESFTYFTARLGGVNGLVNVTTKAIEAEYRDRSGAPWSDWILGTLQEGRVHAVGTTDAALQTFVGAALRTIRPEDPAPELRAAEWMATYQEQLRNLLASAPADERNEDLADATQRSTRLREALESGAAAWRHQERQTIIEAPLAEEKVAGFREQTREAMTKSRVVPDLLRLAGAVTALDAPPDDPPLIRYEPPKGYFTADARFVALHVIARDIGQQVTHLELDTLIRPMTNAEPRALVADDPGADNTAEFREQLRQVVAAAVEGATTPAAVVVLVPPQWQLGEALGLRFLGGGAMPPEDWRVSEGTAHNYAGVFAGAAAYRFRDVPADVLYVVDLSRYASAESWQPSADADVTVAEFGEGEARSRAEQDPAREELGLDEIGRRLRECVIVTVDLGLRVSEERDASALTAITLPTSLRRD